MKLLYALPLCLCLAACSEPPGSAGKSASFDPGPNCQNECAAGYRWAVERGVTDKVKCRGEGEFGRGCRAAVDFARPFGQ